MIKAVLVDIEGTTSSIQFVHNVLFPYARKHMRNYLRANWRDEQVQLQLTAVRAEMGKPDADFDSVVTTLEQWIEADSKVTPLKALQGMLWKVGFQRQDYVSHIYPDAIAGLRRWHAAGLTLAVYSSGSVTTQQQLFEHTEHGDLTALFSGWFDTEVGHKREQKAYKTIADQMQLRPTEILFLSDIEQELDAAAAAGMQTAWLVRDGVLSASPGHPQYASFDSIVGLPQA